ncbi:MAG: bifunctional phosphopantothenoylcysteine decarboxylase/phosphopantothenate--cysteine ligase CoaBC [Sulfurospirillaceae bacterium]|nr:bifunctional phosphopantothenoylcysteine decarboxylase/phosphopantothenate--cysteine ligase CoaBC [Sulfurospirillaceae bacterium]MDD2826244.1 bifunctional phosphopantothenoylcysteine decarboxylase/phosphopantothenate--cysteine ligase CoaBC [Sulfurospirillaceae bacterium]
MIPNLLADKKILLGVTGSIAIYKSLELIRLFIKAGAEVKVLMSEDAKRFITPLTFEAISQNEVLHSGTENWNNELNHIHIGKWADIFVIAPASVNTINKLSHGIADNLLTQSVIAYIKPIVIAPSANTNMILNAFTQESLSKLLAHGMHIVAPQSKLLACNDEGMGALADVEKIFYQTASILLEDSFWKERDVIITGGGTIEKIDDVRCLSNFSSGKQAFALALAYYIKGARVTLISSHEMPTTALPITFLHVKSSEEFKYTLEAAVQVAKLSKKEPYVLMAAAISDYIPKTKYHGKLKKETLGQEISLELVLNEDILAGIDKTGLKVIGFKAEMDETSAQQSANKMLIKKGLHAVCLNILKEENHFGSANNTVEFITAETSFTLPLSSKFEIAQKIVELSKSL